MYENDYSGLGEALLVVMAVAAGGAFLLSLMPWRRARRALTKVWLAVPILLGVASWYATAFFAKNLEPSSPLLIAVFTAFMLLFLWSLPALAVYALLRFTINKVQTHAGS